MQVRAAQADRSDTHDGVVGAGLWLRDLLETDPPALLPIDSEAELGPILLAIVSAAKAQGLDSERALRTALRDLQDEIRAAEQENTGDPADAGVIAFPTA